MEVAFYGGVQMKLNINELCEAVYEWADKRGIDIKGKIVVFSIKEAVGGNIVSATVDDVTLPPQFGPYR